MTEEFKITLDKDTSRTLLWIIEKAKKPEGWLWGEKLRKLIKDLEDGVKC